MTGGSERSRRQFLRATGGTAAAVAFAGCTQKTDPSSNGTAGATGLAANATGSDIEADPSKTLELISSPITTFDPIAASDGASEWVVEQLFDGLTRFPNARPVAEPTLASDYRISADFRTYTFSLKNASFHTGTPVRAQDFVYAWERLAISENAEWSSILFDSLGVAHRRGDDGSYEPGTLRVEAVDDHTLRMTLAEPFHATLETLAYSPLAAIPEGIVGDIPGYRGRMDYEDFAARMPIGAGPFRFVDWQQETEARVARFEDYHGDRPGVAGIRWQILEEDSAVYEYFMNRNADVLAEPSLPTPQYDPAKISIERTTDRGQQIGTYGPLRNGRTVEYCSAPALDTYYIAFNMRRVEKPVRKAIAHVVNQGRFVERILTSRGVPAYHLIPPPIYPGGMAAYNRSARRNYPYGDDRSQPNRARRLMERAGYGEGNRLELSWLQYESETWNRIARLLRDRLANVHIDLRIDQVPFATLLDRVRTGEVETYTFGWVADWPAPDAFVRLLDPTRTDAGGSTTISAINWSQRTGSAANRASRAIQRIENNPRSTEEGKRARNRAYGTIEAANWEDVGILPLYHTLEERFAYEWAQVPPSGCMGPTHQKLIHARIAARRR